MTDTEKTLALAELFIKLDVSDNDVDLIESMGNNMLESIMLMFRIQGATDPELCVLALCAATLLVNNKENGE